RLNGAYDILGDPAKRAAYDQQRLLEEQQREAVRKQQELAQREPGMSWIQGIFGFVRELRRELREP
ncbi:MAG TPA: hypothetical protein VIY29_16170, partial [Ktedonobacteraceae bacterium]